MKVNEKKGMKVMRCQNCGQEAEKDDLFCQICGSKLENNVEQTEFDLKEEIKNSAKTLENATVKASEQIKKGINNVNAKIPRDENGNSKIVDIITFRKMITPTIVKVLYWILEIIIIIASIASFVDGEPLVGIAIFVCASLNLRLVAEFILVCFQMNNTMTDIKNEMRNR